MSIIEQSENDFKICLFKLLKDIKEGLTSKKNEILRNKPGR